MKDTNFCEEQFLNISGKLLPLNKPLIMGILNVTPDSFYSGSRVNNTIDILKKAEKMISDGADILDVGGYSSRPGADDLSEGKELERLIPAVETLHKELPEAILSIDTFRSTVAEESIRQGAHIINDISGGELDEKMFETVARLNVPYILMHMRGNPKNMINLNNYEDLSGELIFYFSKKINRLKEAGVGDIILDPGFGFSKDINQNFELLKNLKRFEIFELPILAGLSRKSMVWKTLNTLPEEALNGSTALNLHALQNGANILRVHDVKEAKEVITLWQKINDL